MAATTKRRRSAKIQVGKEAWQIVTEDGTLVRETGCGEGPALVLAQAHAFGLETDQVMTFHVQLKPLLGPPDTHYRIVRNEDGSVSTYRT